MNSRGGYCKNAGRDESYRPSLKGPLWVMGCQSATPALSQLHPSKPTFRRLSRWSLRVELRMEAVAWAIRQRPVSRARPLGPGEDKVSECSKRGVNQTLTNNDTPLSRSDANAKR